MRYEMMGFAQLNPSYGYRPLWSMNIVRREAQIGVLLVTHGQLGRHLVGTVTGMLGELSLPTDVLEVPRESDPDVLIESARAAAAKLDAGAGVLILTDAFGSTPSNIANRAADGERRRVVAGVNLPMLVRIYNYPELELDAVAEGAVEAGKQGVVSCPTAK